MPCFRDYVITYNRRMGRVWDPRVWEFGYMRSAFDRKVKVKHLGWDFGPVLWRPIYKHTRNGLRWALWIGPLHIVKMEPCTCGWRDE